MHATINEVQASWTIPAGLVIALLSFPLPAPAASGDLDPSFASRGGTRISFEEFDRSDDLVVRPDGSSIIASTSFEDLSCFAGCYYTEPNYHLTRLTAAGNVDPSFGVDGTVTVPVGAGYPDVTSLVEGSDGSLTLFTTTGSSKYSADGALVPGFSAQAGNRSDIGDESESAASAGRIVVAEIPFESGPAVVHVSRLLPDGSLDPSFGGSGDVPLAASNPQGIASAVMPDDSVLVATSEDRFLVVRRISASGTQDATFGTGGELRVPFAVAPSDVAVDPGGGFFVSYFSGVDLGRPGILHATDAGELDPGFGQGGATLPPLTGAINDLAVDPAGALYVSSGKALLRLRQDGVPDPAFGEGGLVQTPWLAPKQQGGSAIDLTDDGAPIKVSSYHGPTQVARSGRLRYSGFDIGVAAYMTDGDLKDLDADGVGDSEDACPVALATGRSGCQEIARHVGIARRNSDRRRLDVVVGTEDLSCIPRGTRVEITRSQKGVRKEVDQVRIRHGVGISRPLPRGRYVGRIKQELVPDVGACGSSRSRARWLG
jgi:uncharacterized delta-60 repeat protein